MTFELDVYSFGNTPPTADGGPGTTAGDHRVLPTNRRRNVRHNLVVLLRIA